MNLSEMKTSKPIIITGIILASLISVFFVSKGLEHKNEEVKAPEVLVKPVIKEQPKPQVKIIEEKPEPDNPARVEIRKQIASKHISYIKQFKKENSDVVPVIKKYEDCLKQRMSVPNGCYSYAYTDATPEQQKKFLNYMEESKKFRIKFHEQMLAQRKIEAEQQMQSQQESQQKIDTQENNNPKINN